MRSGCWTVIGGTGAWSIGVTVMLTVAVLLFREPSVADT